MTRQFLIKYIDGIYNPEENKNKEPMAIIAYFLTDDVGNREDVFQEWLYDESHQSTGSNHTALDKTERGNVVLTDLFTEDPAYFIEMSREQFLKMLDDWKKMRILKPLYILISQDDQGNIKFQALEQPV